MAGDASSAVPGEVEPSSAAALLEVADHSTFYRRLETEAKALNHIEEERHIHSFLSGHPLQENPAAPALIDSAYSELHGIDEVANAVVRDFTQMEMRGMIVPDHDTICDMRASMEQCAIRLRAIRRCVEANELPLIGATGIGPSKQLAEHSAAILDRILYVDGALAEAQKFSADMKAEHVAHTDAIRQCQEMDLEIDQMLNEIQERANCPGLTEDKNFADTEYVSRTGSLSKWQDKLNRMSEEAVKGSSVDPQKVREIWGKIVSTRTLGPGTVFLPLTYKGPSHSR